MISLGAPSAARRIVFGGAWPCQARGVDPRWV